MGAAGKRHNSSGRFANQLGTERFDSLQSSLFAECAKTVASAIKAGDPRRVALS